jgi:hypothetical protein
MNKLLSEYNNYRKSDVPFQNNNMLNNNPIFQGNLRNANFYDKINMSKMENTRRVKSIGEFNLTPEQLTNYIICPIKIEKFDKNELDRSTNERESTYITTTGDTINIPKLVQDWWGTRTNLPYKDILKEENKKNLNKIYEKIDDLIVHKVTQLDKNKIKLMKELEELVDSLETHNDELKIIYSLSEKIKHKEKFEYITKYKHRIKYDPTNYNDLKKYYKKEQNKIKQNNKRIDEIIEICLDNELNNEQLSKEDIEEVQSQLASLQEDGDNELSSIQTILESGEKNLEKKLEKELKKELGEEQYNAIMKELDQDIPKKSRKKESNSNSGSDDEQETRVNIKSKKTKKSDSDSDHDSDKKIKSRQKIKIKIANDEDNETGKTSKTSKTSKTIGKIEEDDLEKYKRKKN